MTAEDVGRLEEIRARDKARGYGHAGVTMTQSEADRRTLLRMLDTGTAAAPVYAWGESITWTDGQILVHLNHDGDDAADLEVDRDDAELLATMLLDAAGRSEDSDGELRAPELDELTEQYLRFLRGQGPEPNLSSLPDGCRAKVEGQFATIRTLRALADRRPELLPLEQDPVAIRLGLVDETGE